jgi:hypothetical protein
MYSIDYSFSVTPTSCGHNSCNGNGVCRLGSASRKNYSLKKLREQRDEKLKQTDKYGLTDYPFRSDQHKQAWLDYRRALRDLPYNSPNVSIDLETGELTGVVWPTEPTILF